MWVLSENDKSLVSGDLAVSAKADLLRQQPPDLHPTLPHCYVTLL